MRNFWAECEQIYSIRPFETKANPKSEFYFTRVALCKRIAGSWDDAVKFTFPHQVKTENNLIFAFKHKYIYL